MTRRILHRMYHQCGNTDTYLSRLCRSPPASQPSASWTATATATNPPTRSRPYPPSSSSSFLASPRRFSHSVSPIHASPEKSTFRFREMRKFVCRMPESPLRIADASIHGRSSRSHETRYRCSPARKKELRAASVLSKRIPRSSEASRTIDSPV